MLAIVGTTESCSQKLAVTKISMFLVKNLMSYSVLVIETPVKVKYEPFRFKTYLILLFKKLFGT